MKSAVLCSQTLCAMGWRRVFNLWLPLAAALASRSEAATPPVVSLIMDSSVAVLSGLNSWGTGSSSGGLELADVGMSEEARQAMVDLCADTMKVVEEKPKAKVIGFNLGGSIAPICELQARKLFTNEGTTFGQSFVETNGSAGSGGILPETVASAVRDWCSNLDGRMSIALEAGGAFVHNAEQPVQKAGQPRPYHRATRREFCDEFAHAVNVSVMTSLFSTSASQTKTVTTKAVPAENMSTDTKARLQLRQPGIDMLRLVQSLSSSQNLMWNQVCVDLVSGLESTSSSVTDREVLKKPLPSRDATSLLTFNAADHDRLKHCAVQLKFLAFESDVFTTRTTQQKKTQSLVATSVTSDNTLADTTSNTLAMEELMDSPWSYDTCADVARGYLIAQLMDSRVVPSEFCHRYATEVAEMQIVPPRDPAEERRKQSLDDLHRLRRRAKENAHLRHAHRNEVSTHLAEQQHRDPRDRKAFNEVVALAAQGVRRGTAVPTDADDQAPGDDDQTDGANFWRTESVF